MSKFTVAPGAASLAALLIEVAEAPDIRTVLDSLTVPGIVHDGSKIVHMNQSFARFIGCDRRQRLVGRELTILAEPADRRSLLAALGAASTQLPKGAHVQRFQSQSGEALVANVIARPTRLDGADQIVALLEPGSATERSSNLLRLLEVAVDHLRDIVFITEAEAIDDVGRRIVFVNQAFTLVTGYELSDVVGKTPSVTIGELTDRAVLGRIERGLKQKLPVHEELLKYTKHGEQYWVELDILPVFDERGVHTHWVSVQRDITERRLLEQKFVENERLASIGLLSGKLALEVNSPLAAAQSSLDYVVEQLPDMVARGASAAEFAALLKALKLAQTNMRAVASTAGQLRLLAGAQSYNRGPTNVCEVLDSAIGLLETTRTLHGRVERHYSSTPLVLADPSRLLHVFHFALENAAHNLLDTMKASNVVSVRVRAGADGVFVEIEDNGVSATSELAEQLFTPFGNRGRRANQGLALFVANCLVRELGGRMDARTSQRGRTMLEVFLPSISTAALVAHPQG